MLKLQLMSLGACLLALQGMPASWAHAQGVKSEVVKKAGEATPDVWRTTGNMAKTEKLDNVPPVTPDRLGGHADTMQKIDKLNPPKPKPPVKLDVMGSPVGTMAKGDKPPLPKPPPKPPVKLDALGSQVGTQSLGVKNPPPPPPKPKPPAQLDMMGTPIE